MKIRTRFSLIISILVIVIFTVVYLFSLQLSRKRIMDDINTNFHTAMQFKAQNIESLIISYKKFTEMLANGILFTQYFNPEEDRKVILRHLNKRVKDIVKLRGDISRIRLLDVNGIVIESYLSEEIGMDKSKNDIFIKGKEGTFVSDLQFSERNGNYIMRISTPVNFNSKFVGVIVINFLVEEKLYPLIKDRTGLIHSTDVYIINKDNYIISPFSNTDDVLKTKTIPEQIKHCRADHEANKISEIDFTELFEYTNHIGKKVFGTHIYIPSRKWFIIAEVDKADIIKPIMEYRTIITVLFLIVLIMSFGIILIISRYLTKPIINLESGIKKIIEGDSNYKVATQSKDEIGQLSRVFDDMIDKLSYSRKKLENHADLLEEQISERTTDLEEKVAESLEQRQAILNIAADLEILNEDLNMEIEVRKKAENQIEKDLREKSTLLQELYHRTKNNMQVISVMLSMQARRSKNEFVKTTFSEIINKIRAMSLVHQKLYDADDLSNINLKEYIEDLSKLLMQSHNAMSSRISSELELENVNILMDSAIPLGLIINEIYSNIFKHAFPDNRTGKISVKLYLEEDGVINLQIGDNGIGIPPDVDLEKSSSMGLSTVFALIKHQIKGTVVTSTTNGLLWHIKFKDDQYKVRV